MDFDGFSYGEIELIAGCVQYRLLHTDGERLAKELEQLYIKILSLITDDVEEG